MLVRRGFRAAADRGCRLRDSRRHNGWLCDERLCGAGWLVGDDFWTDGHAAFWRRPDIADIGAAYEAAWQAREDGKLPKKEARDFGLLFDADRVFDLYWKPVLAELEKRIGYAGSDVSG